MVVMTRSLHTLNRRPASAGTFTLVRGVVVCVALGAVHLAGVASGSAAAAALVSTTGPSDDQPAVVPSFDTISEGFGGYKCETRPCRDATMQFTTPTEVREVLARAGQVVKRGEVLVRARDGELKAALEQQRLVAGNDLDVQGREKQHELAKFRLERLKASKNYSPIEYEEARIAYEISRVQRDAAKSELLQQQSRLKAIEAQYERSFLEAPFDGVIDDVFVEVGQGVSEQTKALRIVSTSQLWLDTYADTRETMQKALAPGARAWVLIDLPTPALVEARVLNVSPVADSVSQTRRVRVEMQNPRSWPAGVQARVRFSEPGETFAIYRVSLEAGDATAESASDVTEPVKSRATQENALGSDR